MASKGYKSPFGPPPSLPWYGDEPLTRGYPPRRRAHVKIGLLNPWHNAAENQLVPIIAQVAKSLGHSAVECKNTQDILRHRPDLVIAMSRTRPKLTHIPTYGLLFDPRDILLERSEYLANIYSYDGLFTLFDTLRVFAEDLLFAAR